MKKILFVCLGNICRSPMAEAMMKQYIKEAARTLHAHGIPYDPDRTARPMAAADYEHYDLIIAMDEADIERGCRALCRELGI